MVGYRTVKVREDVYQRLSRLAAERGKSMSDLIEELLNNYEGKVSNSLLEALGEVKAMLRDCLDKLGVRETRPIETKQPTGPVPAEAKNDVVGGFEDNPWVQILRVRYGSQVA